MFTFQHPSLNLISHNSQHIPHLDKNIMFEWLREIVCNLVLGLHILDFNFLVCSAIS